MKGGGGNLSKWVNVWTAEGTKCFEHGGGVTTEMEVRKRDDYELLRRISDFGLFACEARYYPTCQRKLW